MLRLFRGVTATWPARIFFVLLAGSFALWGVATRNPFGSGDPAAIATVDGETVDPLTIQGIYVRMMAEVRRGNPDVPDAMRREVAGIAAQQAQSDVALQREAARIGVVATDQSIRDLVYQVPSFRGPNGTFDKATMERVLRDNRLTPQRYEADLRQRIAINQLLEAVQAGATGSDLLVRHAYAAAHETRQADAVEVAFTAQPTPEAASGAQLHRWVDNHPELYSSPEYRHIKTIVMTPEEIAKTVAPTEPEIATAYDEHKADFQGPERRTVDVLTAPDEARARDLAAQWRTGADWGQMQAAAAVAGATATEFPDATKADLGIPELADAVFAAPEHTVGQPVQGPLGWYVADVAHVTPAGLRPLAEVHDLIRTAIQRDRAAELMFDSARHVDDLLTGGTPFEGLWSELGLAHAAGTLDKAGRTQAGVVAPIPGPPAVRDAVIAAAFAAGKNDPPRLVPVRPPGAPAGTPPLGHYAVIVDDIIPPAPKPFADVAETARADYARDQVRREANAVAAKLLAAIQGGQTIETAAASAKLPVRHLPSVGLGRAPAGVPEELAKILFGIKPHETAMVETRDGFTVAVLQTVTFPEPGSDTMGLAATRAGADRAMAADTDNLYARAVLVAANPRVNPNQLDALARTSGAP